MYTYSVAQVATHDKNDTTGLHNSTRRWGLSWLPRAMCLMILHLDLGDSAAPPQLDGPEREKEENRGTCGCIFFNVEGVACKEQAACRTDPR